MKIVSQGEIDEALRNRIEDAAPNVNLVLTGSQEELLREIGDADAFLGQITPALLSAAGKLQWVQASSAGLEGVVFSELIESDVTLTNMRGIYNDQGADHALALILGLAKRIPRAIRQQLERRWDPTDYSRVDLSEQTLGIIGLGGIVYELARRGHVCGMRVIAVDPRRTERPPEVAELWPEDQLDRLLGESDFVASCTPHTPQTEGLMTLEKFRLMKPTAFFVNISRGAIVKLDDLVTALEERIIAGAGLDVYETEPLPSEHPLWAQANVIMTPHVAAGGTPVNNQRREELIVENIRRFVNREPLLNMVDKANWF